MPISQDVASPTIILSIATNLGMSATTMTPAQEAPAATRVLDTPATIEKELSVPKTILPVHPAINESLLGTTHLNNCVHQVIPNTNVSMCSSDPYPFL